MLRHLDKTNTLIGEFNLTSDVFKLEMPLNITAEIGNAKFFGHSTILSPFLDKATKGKIKG